MSEDLKDLTRPELVRLAAQAGVPDSNKMTKVELLEALTPQTDVPADPEPEPVQAAEEAPEAPEEPTEAPRAPEADFYPSPYGRRVVQKAVLYTDGTSGTAELNHERAYEYNERFQSNDPEERTSGDESLSEAAAAEKTDEEKRQINFVSAK